MIRLSLFVLLSIAAVVRADAPTTNPSTYPIRIVAETRTDPPMKLWVAQIDLSDPRVQVRVVPGGDDPDGAGPWQTTLMPVSRIAERERFALAVNASFFSVDTTGQYKGAGYVADQPAAVNGWTMTDGRKWPENLKVYPVLWIDSAGRAHITNTPDVGDATQMVAGNDWLIKDGVDRIPSGGMLIKRHPRTAVGVDSAGKTLTILTVDGRQAGRSVGMTGAEMRDELLKYGVFSAINLDGGGSTTLVQRDPATNELSVVNSPSGGKERPVANAVGVQVK